MASPDIQIADLSGGNQQKVVLARWLALRPKVLIVDEPTRGIDIAAKAEVHQQLDAMARAGIAIVAISSELPEVMAISDRIVTMREGRVTGGMPGDRATEEVADASDGHRARAAVRPGPQSQEQDGYERGRDRQTPCADPIGAQPDHSAAEPLCTGRLPGAADRRSSPC